ncbi:ABC transporter ATP-binding protein [Duganella violaceipulchra]|uniref:ABC transporter ATP-binding protein n=1 Tax=Duganella violaceipulchra TaxID=2849652 RepID=A0AA41HI20_9BURK|nr:ABC transporter ATP-binding protein [Duganella violaceicalia]MBV6324173.1 ABC transporter ATP-binding protein [Duganella violaceicalia]MCP2011894.1 ABC-2 type transport system ATP-binding protein [Duganella violaceicalia]
MASVLLNVNQVSKSYGARKAVDGVSFQVQQGQTVGLIGPNGAGKSTTVGMICGLLGADSGSIVMDGAPIGQGSSEAKRKIGFVPQDLALYEDLSSLENLKLFGALYGLKGALLKQRCEQALALVNLADRANDRPSTYSGGMKRRLNIAAALLHDPQLLILDEPTVGVDPQSRNAIFDTLEALKAQGRSLIYTSHYMEEVERLADHIVIIDHGKVLADETPAALYRRLPAQAALRAELAAAPSAALLSGVQALPGVTGVQSEANALDIGLADAAHAPATLAWLAAQDVTLLHFATAKTSLENIFLNLTGRSLRD